MKFRFSGRHVLLWLSLLLWKAQPFLTSPSVGSHSKAFQQQHHRTTSNNNNNGLRQRQQYSLSMSTMIQDSNLKGTSNNDDEKEIMKKSIEEMKAEARKRLDALSKEFSEYQVEIQSHHHEEEASSSSSSTSNNNNNNNQESLQSSKEKEDAIASNTVRSLEKNGNAVPSGGKIENEKITKQKKNEVASTATKFFTTVDLEQPIEIPHADATCLEDTRWKIVFDLGREPGTWMPKSWGASGDRLRFSVVVDLTGTQFYGREEFFDGLAGARVLEVVEATLGPTYWDRQNHGQQQIKVKPTGGYKVVRGAGPMGTDTLRFFIELEEEIVKSQTSDVVCPAGRIYGNCGYFPVSTSMAKDHKQNLKESLQKEYKAVAMRYETLIKEEEEDTRLLSMEKFSRARDLMQTNVLLKRLERRIQEARQREPERSQLRLSRRGDVGLSKEGGVCLKVQKGLALEYHILGRMEVASLQKELPENHEEYEDLVHKLQP